MERFPLPNESWNIFMQPNDEVHEEDLIKVLDVRRPKALATDKSLLGFDDVSVSKCTHQLPKFDLGDIVILIDPVTTEEVYGRILCEWNFRQGAVAPSIIRGDNNIAWFLVEIRGFMSDVKDYGILVKDQAEPPPELHFPKLTGLTNSSSRREQELSQEVSSKVKYLQQIQTYGPPLHLRPTSIVTADLFDGTNDEPNQSISLPQIRSFSIKTSTASGSRPVTSLQSKSTENSLLSDEQIAAIAEARAIANGQVEWSSGPKKVQASKYATKRTLADALGMTGVEVSSLSNDELDRFLRVVAMPESGLVHVGEQHRLFEHEKFARIRAIIQNRLSSILTNNMRWAFDIWKSKLAVLQAEIENTAAIKIQSIARMYCCRHIVPNARAARKMELYLKWKLIHDKFEVVSEIKDKKDVITTNQKILFKHRTDATIYYKLMRMMLSRCVHFLNKKRLFIIRTAIEAWRTYSKRVLEASMKVGHWDDNPIVSHDNSRHVTRSEIEERSARVMNQIQESMKRGNGVTGQKLISISDDNYNNVASIPLALHRSTMSPPTSAGNASAIRRISLSNSNMVFRRSLNPSDPGNSNLLSSLAIAQLESNNMSTNTANAPSLGSNQTTDNVSADGIRPFPIPPTKPSAGIKLPPLPTIPASQGKDGSPLISKEFRPKFNSYRKQVQGPTDSTCWIIPGLLLMGGAPYGKGRKTNWKDNSTDTMVKDCVSLITLAGVGTFVSLLTSKEEQLLEQKHQMEPLINSIHRTAILAKKSLKDVMFHMKCKRDTDQTKLDSMPVVTADHPDYNNSQKEKLKRKAKILNSTVDLERATLEISRFPAVTSWCRYPIEPDTSISKHELLPVIWSIESMLANGERVFVYSRDGYDRAALVCGCILGRLYGLTSTDTLFRLQVHINSCPNQTGITIPINCPQTQTHRLLLEQILRDSNRVYDSVNLRSQLDPQTYVNKLEVRHQPITSKTSRPIDTLVKPQFLLHKGVYEPHDVFMEFNPPDQLTNGRGAELPVLYPGTNLCEDFFVNSGELIDHPPPAEKPTLVLLRRNKES